MTCRIGLNAQIGFSYDRLLLNICNIKPSSSLIFIAVCLRELNYLLSEVGWSLVSEPETIFSERASARPVTINSKGLGRENFVSCTVRE